MLDVYFAYKFRGMFSSIHGHHNGRIPNGRIPENIICLFSHPFWQLYLVIWYRFSFEGESHTQLSRHSQILITRVFYHVIIWTASYRSSPEFMSILIVCSMMFKDCSEWLGQEASEGCSEKLLNFFSPYVQKWACLHWFLLALVELTQFELRLVSRIDLHAKMRFFLNPFNILQTPL